MKVLLDTQEASEELAERGVKRTPKTLRKLRCLGGGPVYRVLNGKPYYTEDDLEAWIRERLSPPRSSSSEAEAPGDPVVDDLLDAGPDLAATAPGSARRSPRPSPPTRRQRSGDAAVAGSPAAGPAPGG